MVTGMYVKCKVLCMCILLFSFVFMKNVPQQTCYRFADGTVDFQFCMSFLCFLCKSMLSDTVSLSQVMNIRKKCFYLGLLTPLSILLLGCVFFNLFFHFWCRLWRMKVKHVMQTKEVERGPCVDYCLTELFPHVLHMFDIRIMFNQFFLM